MSAKAAIEIAIRCGVIPAVAALAVFLAIGWLWPPEVARRYRGGMSFALGMFIGIVLLPQTNSLAPAQFWEWLPHLGLLAAFVAGLTRAAGIARGERLAATYVFAAIAAWLIVPKWPELVPAWPVHWGAFAVGVVALTALLIPLSNVLPGRAFPGWLMLAAAATSYLVMDHVSVSFGRLAAVPAGALAGCWIAMFFSKEPIDWRSLALPYSIVVSGYAFTGYVYPTTPLRAMLLLPLAPLALRICSWGPLARLTGARAFAVQALCVLTPLLIAAAILMQRGGAAAQDW